MLPFLSTALPLAAVMMMASIADASAPVTTLYKFSRQADGGMPQGGLTLVGGTLYGTTSSFDTAGFGTLFRIDPATGAKTTLHVFDGVKDGHSVAALIEHHGILYGTTQTSRKCKGSVFKLDLSTGAETTLHCFTGAADGVDPAAAVIEVAGSLYGTTQAGGSHGYGTIFKLDLATGAETMLYSFKGAKDGAFPAARLTLQDGILYGTTSAGGAFNGNVACASGPTDIGCGVVFRLDPVTRAYGVLHRFNGVPDGAVPSAGVTYLSGELYGVTREGGDDLDNNGFGQGAIFKVNAVSGAEKVVHNFDNVINNGTTPQSDLILQGNMLYGATGEGGDCGCGITFRFDPTGREFTPLSDFGDPFFGYVVSGPIVFLRGDLYGVTQFGGIFDGTCMVDQFDQGCGTVFQVTPQAKARPR